jgi:hypothetical protein
MILTGENGNTERKTSFDVTLLPPRIPVIFLGMFQYKSSLILGNGAQHCGLPPPIFTMAHEVKITNLELRRKIGIALLH